MTQPEVIEQTGANAEGDSSETHADQSTPLTLEALMDRLPALVGATVDERFNTHLPAMFRGLQGVLDTNTKTLANSLGISREDAALLKASARVALGDEAADEITTKADRDRMEQELAALKEREKNQPDAKPDSWEDAWKTEHLPECQDYIEERLGKYDDATMIAARKRMKSDQLTTYATTRDPRGIVGWTREFKKQVDVMEAEQSDTAEKERTTLDTTRSGAGGGSEWDTYQKALKEGGKLPSPEEIDRLTAAHFR